MAPQFKAIAVGLGSSFLGIILLLFIPGLEHYGLEILFRLRGSREVPSEVLIVTMDHESAEILNQPFRTEKWSRFTHANLIETLAGQGAAVIAFDIFFEEIRDLRA